MPADPIDAEREVEEEEPSDTEDVEDAQQSLLSNARHARQTYTQREGYDMTRQGRLRAYWLGVVVCMGGFLCKDAAIIKGVDTN